MAAEQVPIANGGVHLVGSIPFKSNEEVFRRCSAEMPHRFSRIPDGETGERDSFIIWQRAIFAHTPDVLVDFASYHDQGPDPSSPDVRQTVASMPKLRIGYDVAALDSYSVFKRLRDQEKVIPSGTRFLVCLPNPLNFIGSHIKPGYRSEIEPLYEAAVLEELRIIQDNIPAKDLAIQWDMAVDFALLEGFAKPWWNGSVKDGILERIVRATKAVDSGVEVGFHLCYGDMDHKHFKEPIDTSLLVDMSVTMLGQIPREINWFHLPVPKDRDDPAYFAPLKAFEAARGDTMLYLGLVHPHDLEGTQRRIRTALNVVKNFGVATECGMGRTPFSDLESILQISAQVSARVI